MWSETGGTFNPKPLFAQIGQKAKMFRSYQQQDAQELLRCDVFLGSLFIAAFFTQKIRIFLKQSANFLFIFLIFVHRILLDNLVTEERIVRKKLKEMRAQMIPTTVTPTNSSESGTGENSEQPKVEDQKLGN